MLRERRQADERFRLRPPVLQLRSTDSDARARRSWRLVPSM